MKVEFYHRYIDLPLLPGKYVVYYTNFGNIKSSSTWLVPGTYPEDD